MKKILLFFILLAFASGEATIYVGGTVTVPAGSIPGEYTGSYSVSITY